MRKSRNRSWRRIRKPAYTTSGSSCEEGEMVAIVGSDGDCMGEDESVSNAQGSDSAMYDCGDATFVPTAHAGSSSTPDVCHPTSGNNDADDDADANDDCERDTDTDDSLLAQTLEVSFIFASKLGFCF